MRSLLWLVPLWLFTLSCSDCSSTSSAPENPSPAAHAPGTEATDHRAKYDRARDDRAEERPSGTEDPWAEVDENTLSAQLSAAKALAKKSDRLVLLEFVAPWCPDCREVVRISRTQEVQKELREHFVLVPVNVGRFDKHEALRTRFDVKSIATLVVLTPSGELKDKTTMEPVSDGKGITPERFVAWLRQARR